MESWLETIKKNNRAFLDSFKEDSWRPSNFENIQKNPHCEDYKNIFLNLQYHSHIPNDVNYFNTLDRYVKKYNSDKDFRKKVDRYLELTNMNYRQMKNGGWRNPFGEVVGIGPKFFGLFHIACEYRDTELGKEYKRLEFELKELFSKI